MHTRPRVRLPICLIALAALLIGGCATQQPDSTPTEEQTDPRIDQAKQAAQAGRLQEAIEAFEAAARDADGALADRLWLRAGLLHAREGERNAARRSLVRVDADPEPSGVAAIRRLLATTLRLDDDPSQALAAVDTEPPKALPQDLAEYWLETRARALRQTGNPMRAARTREARQRLLTAGPLKTANRDALWDDLMAIPLEALRAAVPARPDTFGGWLELAYAVRTNRLRPAELRDAIDDWYERYPDHPARQSAFAEVIAERATNKATPPERVAVLLPLSGQLSEVGRAIQNGLMTSYYATQPSRQPELVVFDVGADGRDATAAYNEAADRGVDLVIGPLTKSAIETIADLDEHPVPILGLNRLENPQDGPAALYQFGLAPEDDAREAARLMQRRGWHDVVALTPDNDWGRRVLKAFEAVVEQRDGHLLESAPYRDEAQDFGAPIKAALNLDASERRHRRLRRTLGSSIQLEPRRRQDVDAIFMAAFPQQARLIKPQLRFHRAIDVPTVATSHAYQGQPAPSQDKDINGLIIVDTPWTLGTPLASKLAKQRDMARATWPDQARNHPRLMALGIDAFQLSASMEALADEPTLSLPGLTGRLSIDDMRLVHRGLQAGMFKDGVVNPLGDPGGEPETAPDSDQANAGDGGARTRPAP